MNLEEQMAAEDEGEADDEDGEAPEDDPGGEEAKAGRHPTVRIKISSVDLELFLIYHCRQADAN